MNNVLKHAQASQIKLSVQFNNSGLSISIIDNGKGFDVFNENNNGLGLQNIVKRASLIGGYASVISENEKGTSIKLNIPYE